MDARVAALLGAVVGGVAGVAGQVVAAAYTSRRERSRLAIEAGLREWQVLTDHHPPESAAALPKVFPAMYFMYLNSEVIRLIEKHQLTPANYRDLDRRAKQIAEGFIEANWPGVLGRPPTQLSGRVTKLGVDGVLLW